MTFFDWLSSSVGVEVVHALILLAIASAGYLNFLSHRAAEGARDAIEQHVKEHQDDEVKKC